MGSYTFRWAHPAEEVFVTGTFDQWRKSVKLDKVGDVHEKTVNLPSNDKVLYKFVADGEWKHDHTAKSETDHEGNVNNVIDKEDIQPDNAAAAFLSSVAPGASTTAMAGEQPLERKASPIPGAFPETPAPDDNQSFSVNPLPGSTTAGGNPINLAPGEKVPESSQITTNPVDSNVRDDPELMNKVQEGEQTFGVAPIPASGGVGNPINLAPGEKVPDPSTYTNNTVDSTARTDQASYERGDASAPTNAANEQFQQTPQAFLGGPGPVIPESGMAMGNTNDISKENIGPTISSAAAGSSTAALAGQVPLESRGVPEVVSESQQEAHADPEAAANPEAVDEKKQVEQELQQKVPETPATDEAGSADNTQSSSGIGVKLAAGLGAAGAAAAGAAVAANEYVKDKTNTDPKFALPESVQKTVDEKAKESSIPQQTAAPSSTTTEQPATTTEPPQTTSDDTDHARETTTTVPEEVKESQAEAGEPAEASAVPEAVQEKAAVEQELLKKVPESEAQGEPAPGDSAALTATAPAVGTTTSSTGAPQLGDPTAGVAPISLPSPTGEGLNAPATSEAKAPADKLAQPSEPTGPTSGDVSPLSGPATQSETPQATTGVTSASVPAATPRKNGPSASTPQKRQSFVDRLKGTPESSKTTKTTDSTDSKKEKRRSLFGKIKDKLRS